MAERFDVVVIGGGPAGEHAAGRARKGGLSVALVERELVGGECSYWGCMPSKTLLRPGQVLAEVRAVPGAAAAVTGALDVRAALDRRDWMVSSWSDAGQVDWLDGAGVSLFRGTGRLSGERLVTVQADDGSTVDLEASKAVLLAVGTTAALPPIPGLAEAHPWTNREATAAEEVPERLVVLGGGAIGVELAQAFRRLGSSSVTILEGAERLVATTEPFVGEALREMFEREGITVRTGARAVGVTRREAGAEVTVTLESGGEVVGDELLVAVGRRARTGDLGLEALGIEPGRQISTNAREQVEGDHASWLYAIGDVNGKALLTHMGKYQARIAVDNVLGIDVTDEADGRAVTGVVFTDPQIATVGLTEAQATSEGRSVRTVSMQLSSLPAASIWGEGYAGRCQLVVEEPAGVPVGATFLGPGMGDALHAATIAVVAGIPMTTLRHAVPAFPSMSELWLELVEAYFAS